MADFIKFESKKTKRLKKSTSSPLDILSMKTSSSGAVMAISKNSSPRDNVKVVVRIRPGNEDENNEKYRTVTEAISDHMLVFDPKVARPIGFLPTNKNDVARRRYKDLKYAFDFVFNSSASNKDIFLQTTGTIVQGVLDGYNCSVFAYGATGAGKTHTMLGSSTEPGVIYHTMIDLYKRINEQKDDKSFDVSVSYSEVYNEQVRDLLMPGGNLPIREDKTVGVIIAGLSLHKPKSAEELLHMLHFGNQNRTQHPTDANSESSRSHAVFQVFVSQRSKMTSINTEVKLAKMCLVDLAGSERAHATKNHGARFREGANINRSLLALGNVINALADAKFKGHIPYRDSKLTRLLKDSLGGNCRTVMIAAVSPSSKSFDDTYNTLRYADRAKHIRADLKKNVVNVDVHVANYKKYVQDLEQENQELRRINKNLKGSLVGGAGGDEAVATTSGINELGNKLTELFKARKELRKAQMVADGAKRELKWKVARKEKTIRRVNRLTQSLHVIGKHSRVVERMKRRIEKEDGELSSLCQRLKRHEETIQEVCTDALDVARCGSGSTETAELHMRVHTTEALLHDTGMCLAFVKKMARAQERQAAVNEKLVSVLISLVKKQYDILNSQAPNLLYDDLKGRYEECCYLVEERGVAWVQGGSPVIPRVDGRLTEEEEGEVCISDIIDINVPRIQVSVTRPASPSKHVLAAPQRVVKRADSNTDHIKDRLTTAIPQRVAKKADSSTDNIKDCLTTATPQRVAKKADSNTDHMKERPLTAATPQRVVKDADSNTDHVNDRLTATPLTQRVLKSPACSMSARDTGAKEPDTKPTQKSLETPRPTREASLNQLLLPSHSPALGGPPHGNPAADTHNLSDNPAILIKSSNKIAQPREFSSLRESLSTNRKLTYSPAPLSLKLSGSLVTNPPPSTAAMDTTHKPIPMPRASNKENEENKLELGTEIVPNTELDIDSSPSTSLNDTFEVMKPPLPNTPCIDSKTALSTRQPKDNNPTSAPTTASQTPSNRKTPQRKKIYHTDKQQTPNQDKSSSIASSNNKGSNQVHPKGRKSSSPSYLKKFSTPKGHNSSSVSNQGSNSSQTSERRFRFKSRRLSIPSVFLQNDKNKSNRLSMTPPAKWDPSSAIESSSLRRRSLGHGYSSSSNQNYDLHFGLRRPQPKVEMEFSISQSLTASPHCHKDKHSQHRQNIHINTSNSNNVSSSPRSYAEAVKSPALLALNNKTVAQSPCFKGSSKACANISQSNSSQTSLPVRVPVQTLTDKPDVQTSNPQTPSRVISSNKPLQTVMTTPDFSNKVDLNNLMNSLPRREKSSSGEVIASKRQPLRQLKTNTTGPSNPVNASSDHKLSTAEMKVPMPASHSQPIGGPWKQAPPMMKASRWQPRTQRLTSDPYVKDRVMRVKKSASGPQRVPRAGGQPSYMLPTISTSQRLGARADTETISRRDTVIGVRRPYAVPKSVIGEKLQV